VDDNSSNHAGFLDNAAVALSGICLLHCLTLPVLIAVVPFMSQFGEGHFHAQMLLVVLPVSVIAFTLGFRRHHVRRVAAWGVIGMLLLVLGATVVHSSFGLIADRVATICAALILASAHYFNNRLSRHTVANR
jgi:hypothetical protein